MSAIDSKPINPPYLKLVDLDAYIKSEGQGSAAVAGDKKKEPNSLEKGAGAGKDDLSATMTSKKNTKTAEGSQDYKAEMEDFRRDINDLYFDASVKLMLDVENKRKEEERKLIDEQHSKFKK